MKSAGESIPLVPSALDEAMWRSKPEPAPTACAMPLALRCAPCTILPTGAATVFAIAIAFSEAWQTKTGTRLSRASLMECS